MKRPPGPVPSGLALAVAFGIGWSCGPARMVQSASSPVGCYQFERGPGARALGLPWGVELEDVPLGPGWPLTTGIEGVRRALTETSPTERADHPFGYWRGIAADSVEIGHPGGGGVVLTLAREGQDLIGRGVAAGDAVSLGGPLGPRPPEPVVARRVLCGAS